MGIVVQFKDWALGAS